MIMEESKTVTASSGIKETKAFSMNLDGTMFHNLISGIYSDKIAAPIRELSTNSKDGHQRAGKADVKFDVYLPTRMEPEFAVRDYGSSLTHEEIMDMYSVVGKSTKRDSNDETGCLGLGSKSPFAYTSAFSVTCWLNNEKRVYACYKSEGGNPQVSLISTIPSKESQGMQVSFAVKSEDVTTFNRTASKVLVGFVPKPNIVRKSPDYVEEERIPVIKTDSYKIFESNRYGRDNSSYAVMGSVAYPIDNDNKALQSAIRNMGNPEYQLLINTDMVIHFPIGSLTNTTSREELAYDPKTCDAIAGKLTEILNVERVAMGKAYDNCKNVQEAQYLYSVNSESALRTKLAQLCSLTLIPKFQGTTLNRKFGFKQMNASLDVSTTSPNSSYSSDAFSSYPGVRFQDMSNITSKFEIGSQIKPSFNIHAHNNVYYYNRSNVSYHKIYDDANILVQLRDNQDFSINNKVRRFYADVAKKGEINYWFEVSDLAEWDKIAGDLYLNAKNVHFLHELVDLKMPSKAKIAKTKVVGADDEITLRVIKGYAYGNNSTNEVENVKFSKKMEKIVAVYQKGQQFFFTDQDRTDDIKSKNNQDMQYHLNMLQEKLMMDTKISVYVLNMVNTKLEKEWKCFETVSQFEKRKVKEKLSLLPKIFRFSANQDLKSSDSAFFNMFKDIGDSEIPDKYSDVIKRRNELSTNKPTLKAHHNSNSSGFITLCETHFPDELKKVRDSIPKSELRLNPDYELETDPVLKMIYERSGYYGNQCHKALKHYCSTLIKMENKT